MAEKQGWIDVGAVEDLRSISLSALNVKDGLFGAVPDRESKS